MNEPLRLPNGTVVHEGAVIYRQPVPIVRELHRINMKPTMLSAAIAVALLHG